MPVVGGRHVNPFYRQVDPYVVNELNARGNIHGQRVRGASRSATAGIGDMEKNLGVEYTHQPLALF